MSLDLSLLSDEQLEERLAELVRNERERTIEVIACLAELHRRHLAARRGYSGLFTYCTAKLGYTPAQAMRRITAARLSVKHPKVLEKLEKREMPFSAVRLIAPVLTASNADALIEQAARLSFAELEKVAATLDPKPLPPDRVKIIGVESSGGGLEELPLFTSTLAQETKPAAEAWVSFSFAGGLALKAKIDRAKQLLWHKFPEGRLEDVIGQALEDLLDKRDPDRQKERRRPATDADGSTTAAALSPEAEAAHRRYIPLWVRADVWKRDGGRCAYTTCDGVRCEERSGLEYDHVVPWALGGPSDEPDNIRLLCRAHNQLLARERFGPPPERRASA